MRWKNVPFEVRGLQFLVGHLLGLLLLLAPVGPDPSQGITGDDQACRHECLALGDHGVPADLLDLAVVSLEDVVLALEALAQREED